MPSLTLPHPGAIVWLGLALWLGARRLKTLDGAWIVLSSVYLLWLIRS